MLIICCNQQTFIFVQYVIIYYIITVSYHLQTFHSLELNGIQHFEGFIRFDFEIISYPHRYVISFCDLTCWFDKQAQDL